MKPKILNFLLIITSLFGYLEWGGNNDLVLIKAEAEIFSELFSDPVSIFHPFILLPIVGQTLLLITLLQKTPSKTFTYIGVACLGLLLGFMFVIGLIVLNFKILISTLPFIITAVFTMRYSHKLKRVNQK